MIIYTGKDYYDVSRKAANIMSAQIIMKPNAVLGLATGSTPVGMYKQLIEWYKKGDLDFSQITSVNLDEYKGLSGDNDQSYRYFMNTNLFDHVNIDKARTYVPNGLETMDDVPKQAYTMGIKNIMTAKKILLVATGEAKADALYKSLYGPITPNVPASILQLHPDVTVVADEGALKLIREKGLL